MARLPLMIALDVDGNGAISAEEVQSAPMTLRKLDKNSDGALTMDELLPETMTASKGPSAIAGAVGVPGAVIDPAQMAVSMMTADVNNDGFIDKSETPQRMQLMFARADVNRDGRLSREEVTQLATSMSERRDKASGRADADARSDADPGVDANNRQAEAKERSIRARQ